jgi:DNA-binding response OmpR family regulator
LSHPAQPTILYAEDEPDVRLSFAWLLSLDGFTVREAATGAEALRLAAEGPDLILLDVHLPDLSGLEVCRRLKAHPATRGIPVALLSALEPDSVGDGTGATELSPDASISKLTQPAALSAQLHALLRTSRQHGSPAT